MWTREELRYTGVDSQLRSALGDATFEPNTLHTSNPLHDIWHLRISWHFADGIGLDNFAWGQCGNFLWKVGGL